jgi:hypothetical protein
MCAGDSYAFKKPNVLKRPQEQPMMESQPARPPSGGMSSIFSPTSIITSVVEGAGSDVSGVSTGIMKTLNGKLSVKSTCLTVLPWPQLLNQWDGKAGSGCYLLPRKTRD